MAVPGLSSLGHLAFRAGVMVVVLCPGAAAQSSCSTTPCGANTTCHELNTTSDGPGGRICDCLPGFSRDGLGECGAIDFCDGPCLVQVIWHGGDGDAFVSAGWQRDGVPFSTVTSCGNYGALLGGVGEATAGTVLSRQFSSLAGHAEMVIELRVVALDLWENETLELLVDGTQRAVLDPIDSAATGPAASECGLAEGDVGVLVLAARFAHSTSSATVAVRASANLGLARESWGVLDFRLELHSPGPCHACSPNATCSSSPSGSECGCNTGLVGSGESCEAADVCSAGCDMNAACNASGACVCNPQYSGDGSSCAVGDCLLQIQDLLADFFPAVGWTIFETGSAVTDARSCPPFHVLVGNNQLVPGNTLQKTYTLPARHSRLQFTVLYKLAGNWQGEKMRLYLDGVLLADSDGIFSSSSPEPCGDSANSLATFILRSPHIEHSASSVNVRVHVDSVAGASHNNSWAFLASLLVMDGVQKTCSGENDVCHGADSATSTCECRPGFEGDPCVDVDECAAPACARLEVVDDFSLNGPAVGWPINAISSCGPLPLHLGGFGALSTQTMSKEFAVSSTHSSVAIELQLVIIDSWAAVDVIQVFVDGRRVGQTPTPISSNTGALVCGDAAIPDPGLVVISLPETAHSGPTLQLELVPSLASPAAAWGIARVSITLDPSANPGCNECSRPHMVCTNKPGTAACACEAGYYRLGNECVDVDECAEDYVLENVFTSTGEETGWYDATSSFLRPTSLTQTSTCGGATMLGGPGMLGKFTMPERAFGSLPSHNALTVSLTLYIIDSWDADTVTMLVDGAAVDSLTLTHPPGTSSSPTGCGNATADVGLVVLTAHMANHSASDVVVRLTTDLAKPMAQAGYGIVSATITLHSAVCKPGEACANTAGSVNCTCDGDYVYTADGQACVVGSCPAFGEFEHNGFNLTGCAQGHAEDRPECSVACAAGSGGAANWTCARGGAWLSGYPICFEYEPALNATAGAQYSGPPVSLSIDLASTSSLAATVSATNLDPADSLAVSNNPADFGAITALFSPNVDRTGLPVRVRLNLSYTDGRAITHAAEIPEFELELSAPLAASGSTQFAFAGQAYIGQEPKISGGKPPYSFGLGAGTLPAGFTINSKGTIIGTTAQVGDFSGVVVQVTDANGASIALEPINFQIIPALEVSTNASGLLPTAVAGIEYFQGFNFTAAGGSGEVTFQASGSVPASLAVDPQTGALIGFPLSSSARAEPYLFEIIASDDSGIKVTALVVSLVVEAQPDCSNPINGPNGQGCGTGLCVDMVALDGAFTCECNATGLGGDNCQLVDGGGDVTVSRSAAGTSPAVSGSLGALAGLLLILVVVALLVRRAQVRARNQPFDFKTELERMREEGLIVFFVGEDEEGVPREIKRDNIQLLDKLGAGQFGDVFKGTVDDSAATGIPTYLVAVKTLKGDPSSQEMTELMREAALMAQFRHPNVVNLVGVCTRGEPYYLVSQFCENGALSGHLKAQKRPLKEAVMMKMAHEIATGMEYLAGAGLVHRDLAARNVLLDSQLMCKVADFGMSRDVTTTDKDYYRAGHGGMLPVRWAAPEALDEQLFSQQSDVWAWGITVYEILTGGALPYDGWTNQKVWVHVRDGYRLPCPKGFDAAAFEEVVMPCWHESPKERPTFDKLCKQLESRFLFKAAKPINTRASNCYVQRPRRRTEAVVDRDRYSSSQVDYNTVFEPVFKPGKDNPMYSSPDGGNAGGGRGGRRSRLSRPSGGARSSVGSTFQYAQVDDPVAVPMPAGPPAAADADGEYAMIDSTSPLRHGLAAAPAPDDGHGLQYAVVDGTPDRENRADFSGGRITPPITDVYAVVDKSRVRTSPPAEAASPAGGTCYAVVDESPPELQGKSGAPLGPAGAPAADSGVGPEAVLHYAVVDELSGEPWPAPPQPSERCLLRTTRRPSRLGAPPPMSPIVESALTSASTSPSPTTTGQGYLVLEPDGAGENGERAAATANGGECDAYLETDGAPEPDPGDAYLDTDVDVYLATDLAAE